MTHRSFLLQLTLLTAASAAGLWLMLGMPQLAGFEWFGWGCLIFFVLLTIAMFYAGHSAARSSNKNDFTNAAIGFSGGKIFLSAIIILMYVELAAPTSKFFILPFFALYIIYTVFEVYFMSKLGRMKP